ncbi:MAG TPA: YfhO family protein [Chryseolinea sp.]|nr:YfhO family protein [Chryseolinea sp.]HPM30583.1 YfhO family protein [Chryseolinea sp.]
MKIPNWKTMLPHGLAVLLFLAVTIVFFNPIFSDNKVLAQPDIQQFRGSYKTVLDYRTSTGEEALWAPSMFSGMPAYLVSVHWGDSPLLWTKQVLSFFLPHPVSNIFLAFICYYILLLAFGIRPYLAIAGAIAFGLSSYMIVGLIAGHNNRVGAIAFMPLVIAGIHLAFSKNKILGFGLTTAGLALHLRENHLQITYYLFIIILVYGIIELIVYIKQKQIVDFIKTIGLLIVAAGIAVGTFFGSLWAITEYTTYSTRGKSELVSPSVTAESGSGLDKSYAFNNSYGLLEPLTLFVPNFYGGSSSNYLISDQNSKSYKALASSGDNQLANQLANYTGSYWGPQQPFGAIPYYAGAIITFLFAVGIAFADKKYVWWLVSISVISLLLTYGSNLPSFNYFLFDHLPGYNKFRSVTFTLVIILFAMPLLGMLGLEKLMTLGLNKDARKKLLIVLGSTGGICLLLLLFAGAFSFLKDEDGQLPPWFMNALAEDRKNLLQSDAFRSLAFIVSAFVVIYFEVWKKISPTAFYAFLIIMITFDLAVVDKRYLIQENYQRKRDNTAFALSEADQEILKDKSYYRVFNLMGAMNEAKTSYSHYSIGGYHGAKLRRYMDLYDSCLFPETNTLIQDLRSGRPNFETYGILNMLNAKYFVFGDQRNNIIPNPNANGAAWFVQNVVPVNSPTEELQKLREINTTKEAVIDNSKFKATNVSYDSASTIQLKEFTPPYIKYESESSVAGLGVFSEIYYPKGWVATIDGKETEILRANYVLRALSIPAGKHTIEFTFKPDAFYIGNKVTMASSWIMMLVLLGSLGWSLKKE